MKRNPATYTLPLALLAATALTATQPVFADSNYGQERHATPADSTRSSDLAPNTDPSRPRDTDPAAANTGSSSDRASSSGSMADAAITAKVKSALVSAKDIPSTQIKVETNNGIVQLSGFLNSQDEIDRAVSVARNVSDVKGVENNMQTK